MNIQRVIQVKKLFNSFIINSLEVVQQETHSSLIIEMGSVMQSLLSTGTASGLHRM
ncbi:hypothetical protein JOE23_003354 [Amphibacillus cookii]|nr:hypothetical protein [Amphibacillus cookii]